MSALQPPSTPPVEDAILAIRGQKVLLDADLAPMYGVTVRALNHWGGRRYLPRAFTEQGVAMLSSVLRSEKAALVNVEIMRAFVRLRQMLQQNAELARKLTALEKKYDAQFRVVFDAIRELMDPPSKQRARIGFKSDKE